MRIERRTWQLTLAWVGTVIVTAIGATMLSSAQTGEKRVVSGSELGFRIDSERGGVPTGHFVIRVNGNWVEVKESVGVSKLTQ